MATSATPMPPSHHQQRVGTEVSQGKCHGRDCLCCPPQVSHDSLHPIPPHPDAGHRLFIVFLNGCYIRAAAAAVWMFPFAREESKKAYLPISEWWLSCMQCVGLGASVFSAAGLAQREVVQQATPALLPDICP